MSDNYDEKKTDETKGLELPPMPMPLLDDLPEEALEFLKYKGDPSDMGARLRHKLILMWLLYGFARNDEKLIEIVNKTHNKESDLWYLCNKMVNILDQWARVLITTDILEELASPQPQQDPVMESAVPISDLTLEEEKKE